MAGLYLSSAPMTAQAQQLGLTAEIQENCRVVYEKDPEGEGYVFHSLWHPEGEYGENHIIMPVGSTYMGLTEEFPVGKEFANVIWSSTDPQYKDPYYPSHCGYMLSWIKMLRKAYAAHADKCRREGKPVENYSAERCCAELDTIYPSDGSREFLFECSNNGVPGEGIYLHGAHVLIGATESGTVKKGGFVHLLPLCENHNTYDLHDDKKWGQGYYMKLGRPMRAVLLALYMEKPIGPFSP